MNPTIPESTTSIAYTHRLSRTHILHIVFICLAPLLWLALIVGSIVLLTSLIRHLTAPAGFFVEQQINVIAVSAGLVLSAIVYTAGNVRALRIIRKWEREGKHILATGGLLGLGITAFTAITLPILLIFFTH